MAAKLLILKALFELMDEFINNIFENYINIINRLSVESKDTIISIAKLIASTFLRGGKIYIMGNGGSTAGTQHIAAEFVNKFKIERPPLPVIAITSNSSILSLISEESSFEDIFLKQIMAYATSNDIIWAISSNGNAASIIKALQYCSKNNITTIGFTCSDGGAMSGICDILLTVPTNEVLRVQELHLLAAHLIGELVDEILFGKFGPQLDA
jgi:D-sedoheptulose 7-phosphate isomerase